MPLAHYIIPTKTNELGVKIDMNHAPCVSLKLCSVPLHRSRITQTWSAAYLLPEDANMANASPVTTQVCSPHVTECESCLESSSGYAEVNPYLFYLKSLNPHGGFFRFTHGGFTRSPLPMPCRSPGLSNAERRRDDHERTGRCCRS